MGSAVIPLGPDSARSPRAQKEKSVRVGHSFLSNSLSSGLKSTGAWKLGSATRFLGGFLRRFFGGLFRGLFRGLLSSLWSSFLSRFWGGFLGSLLRRFFGGLLDSLLGGLFSSLLDGRSFLRGLLGTASFLNGLLGRLFGCSFFRHHSVSQQDQWRQLCRWLTGRNQQSYQMRDTFHTCLG